MKKVDYHVILSRMIDVTVERPNKKSDGTLSGHAAGEPFEKCVYQHLKELYPKSIFKQFEYLNDLYLKHPKVISVQDRYALLDSPTALFLLSRGDKATKNWSPENVFEEKQNDTADIMFYNNKYYDLIDVKTRNKSKDAQPPNIISAYKLAQACACMIDNKEYDNLDINYIEIDWIEENNNLKCVCAHHASLFNASPKTLYINWAAGMQIQFHVSDLDQTWKKSRKEWAHSYIKVFVESARHRCKRMEEMYIKPFLKYI
ncbi:MAG: HincII family type II restriction endonuclease [Paludibacteraceae bacterium]|nr:HincII family type II restriction endonuclease [Paludibacteraceae bacterium]